MRTYAIVVLAWVVLWVSNYISFRLGRRDERRKQLGFLWMRFTSQQQQEKE